MREHKRRTSDTRRERTKNYRKTNTEHDKMPLNNLLKE